ncbi:LOW QUALITY PROTEIN: uncharacterized protein LOC134505898 [Candoia aspera]|uniref:LOW QUALITY PROTEIN: uncharacterized protein LOC134505898 n=1 Tax=Candoia aspera TaxID=51853 RepID=UPI002FD8078D
MLSAPLLFTLLTYCSGAFAQYLLTQPPSVSGSLGQNARVTCAGNNIGGKKVRWYQQKPGSPPVLIIYADSQRSPTGTSDRFSGTNSGNTATLSFSAVFSNHTEYLTEVWRRLLEDYLHLNSGSSSGDTAEGAHSQYTLTQPAAQSSPLGQSAKISCTMSRDSQVGSYSIAWYQQHPGKSPKYLLYDANSNGRFTGSKDTSANAAYLTIASLQADDEADYYCGGAYGSGSNWSGQVQSYYQSWYQQQEGGPPRFLYRYYNSAAPGSGDLSRFSASKEGSQNKWYLTINNVQPEDEAAYYCAVWYHPSSEGGLYFEVELRGAALQFLCDPHNFLQSDILWTRKRHATKVCTMAWILIFLAFLSDFSGAISQPTLTQPVSQSASPGETIKLSCAISSSPNNIRWLQQRSGEAPRFVHCDGCNRGPGIPDRFTGTRSGNNGYLTITSLQAEDEADYYCFMWYSSGNVFHSETD